MEEQSSAQNSPVELQECIEEIVKFTLESHMNQTLEFNLGLSNDLCFYLLEHNQHQPTSDSTGSLEQVPLQPLYKQLALVLYQLITSGDLCGTSSKMELINEDDALKQRREWKKLVMDEGTELLKIVKTINFELHVQEPHFTHLKDGLKTVEGRCAVGDLNRIASGTFILINRILVLKVQDVHRYPSFYEMLEGETLGRVLPGVQTIDEGVKVYRKFYTEEKERSNGVRAICVTKSVAQPYISLARILYGLSYSGLESILGVLDLPRTTLDAVST